MAGGSFAHGESTFFGLTSAVWIQIGILSALMAAVFRFSLLRLYLKTNPFNGEANWGHSFCVPIIGLYYLYLNSDALMHAPVLPRVPGRYSKPQLLSGTLMLLVGVSGFAATKLTHAHDDAAGSAIISIAGSLSVACMGLMFWAVLTIAFDWGLSTLLFGLLLFGYGIWPGQNDFVKDFGGVVTLFGLVLLLCGWQVMRIAWFPITFLICAIPWPPLVYSWVASPLQRVAAAMAVMIMNIVGVDSTQNGTKIYILSGIFNQPPHALNVAEACAGLRSLMTFISLAIAIAFLSPRAMWQRIIISVSAIPIAIFCNVMRVTGTGILYRFGGSDWAEGFTHQFIGLVMLVPAFFMILAVAWVLDHLFVEEVDLQSAGQRKIIRRGPSSLGVAQNLATAPVATAPVARPPTGPRRGPRRTGNGGGS